MLPSGSTALRNASSTFSTPPALRKSTGSWILLPCFGQAHAFAAGGEGACAAARSRACADDSGAAKASNSNGITQKAFGRVFMGTGFAAHFSRGATASIGRIGRKKPRVHHSSREDFPIDQDRKS